TGEERWSFDAGERISGSPSVVGRYAYVSTLAPKGATGATYAVHVQTGRRVWAFPRGRYSPAVRVEGELRLTGRERLSGLGPRGPGAGWRGRRPRSRCPASSPACSGSCASSSSRARSAPRA